MQIIRKINIDMRKGSRGLLKKSQVKRRRSYSTSSRSSFLSRSSSDEARKRNIRKNMRRRSEQKKKVLWWEIIKKTKKRVHQNAFVIKSNNFRGKSHHNCLNMETAILNSQEVMWMNELYMCDRF